MDKMAVSLQKTMYASSPAMVSSLCAEVCSEAATAADLIAVLPWSNIELEHTADFAARTGDYMSYLLKRSAGGHERTDEEAENLASLSANAAKLSEQISALQFALLSGELSIDSMAQTEEELGEHDETEVSFGSEIAALEEEFPEMPTLIYDGPFSDAAADLPARFLEDKAPVTEEKALDIAASYSGVSKTRLHLDGVRGEEPAFYILSGGTNDELYFEITRKGGCVFYFENTRSVGDAVLADEEAVRIAERFLANHGFDHMQAVYREKRENRLTVSFVYTQNGTLCYPDQVKVTVALDAGAVVAFDSQQYVMSHTARQLQTPALTPEEAGAGLSSCLTAAEPALAVIPTAGKSELLCYEFRCRDREGNVCLVYVNADTGEEARILLLLEDENGTLTI